VALKADALVVHHGLFWRGHDGRVTGWLKERLALLLAHQINLYAYHLPLDAHETLGNNAQLAQRLGLTPDGRFGEQSLGWLGSVPHTPVSQFVHKIEQVMGRSVTQVLPPEWPGDQIVHRIAWCTGGAQSYFESAIAAGAEVFLTGEISEPQAHYARECGVAYLACGHHATERYGAPALGDYVASKLGLSHIFVDIDNPA
jgi:dinuclear metal center YbgI/SA1388 family protein